MTRARAIIQRLPEHVANQIAAGEVVERPASVVKELVENALDAGSRTIEVEIREGGREYIRVRDDGEGIPAAQVPLAFERHATSKIRRADDLLAVTSLGFRGEALPSIASVSELEMRTRTADEDAGTLIHLEGGRVVAHRSDGCPPGTTIIVRRLFFNTPARYKFLRTAAAESRHVLDTVGRLALARPDCAFTLIVDGRPVLRTPGDGDLRTAIGAVLGRGVERALLPCEARWPGGSVKGWIAHPDVHRGNRDFEIIIVNGRPIHSPALMRAVEKGYETLLPSRRFPAAVIHLRLEPGLVDVNVHPTKREVRFSGEQDLFRQVLHGVRDSLVSHNLLIPLGRPDRETAPRPVRTGRSVGEPQPGEYRPEEGRPGERRRPGAVPAPDPLLPLPWDGPVPWVRERRPGSAGAARPIEPLTAALGEETAAKAWGEAGAPPAVSTTVSPSRGRCARDLRSAPDPSGSAAALGWTRGLQGDVEAVRQTLRELRLVGSLDHTFWIGVHRGELWIIDQHIAHERVLYERLLRRPETLEPEAGRQRLLHPLLLELSAAEAAALHQHERWLYEAGFELESFGPQAFRLTAVPTALSGTSPRIIEGALREALLLFDGGEEAKESRLRELAAQLACRMSVKAGEPVPLATGQALLRELAAADNPFTCPHGRPIIAVITRHELERRFLRQ